MAWINAAKFTALVGFALACFACAHTIWIVPDVLHEEAKKTRDRATAISLLYAAVLDEQLTELRHEFRYEVAHLRSDVAHEAKTAREAVLKLVDLRSQSIEATVAEEIGATRAAIIRQGQMMNASLDQMAQAGPALARTGLALSDAIERADHQFLESGLAESRFRAITQETALTMDAGRRIAAAYAQHAPENAQAMTTISSSAAKVADELGRKHLGAKLLLYEIWRHVRFLFNF
jgi:F0F1-type ATP synthase membrane subunit b/b'